MVKILLLLGIVLQLVLAQICIADLYQYTDKDGVVHFTDDPGNVPKQERKTSRKEGDATLTTKESKMLQHVMELDKTRDVSFPGKDLNKIKKNLNNFAEGYKENYDDPEQRPDSRLATPEGALNLFRSALKSGNMNDLKASMTSHFWDNGKGFGQLNREQLLEFEKLVSKHKVVKREQKEHFALFELIETQYGHEVEVGSVKLMNLFGNWRVEEF